MRLAKNGKRYGSLIALRADPASVAGWIVRCDCGTEKSVRRDNLTCGRQLTCGRMECPYHRAAISKSGDGYIGAPGFRWAVYTYKAQAKKRRVEFNLTNEECGRLFRASCVYCGAPPSNVARRESKFGVFLYSGIDRIDPTQGYAPGNVQPCCWVCNEMKKARSERDFLAHVHRIIAYRKQAMSR